VQGGNFLADNRIIRGFVNIDLRPVRVLLRDVGVREDGLDRTLRHARIAINAGIGVDVEPVGQFVKCFDRTNGRAIRILAVHAQLCHHVCHLLLLPFFV
jgi:hypothetical protein